jgi:RHS repeat-associated protein
MRNNQNGPDGGPNEQRGTGHAKANGPSGFDQAPSIALPKGGGAIRGIGEKFATNPVTGTGSLTVPIYTSPGRSGFGPQLSLSYDSGSGNGPFGLGWSLGLPSITRKTDKGLPQYTDAQESDTFILSGAEDLVPLLVENNGKWSRDVSARTIFGKQYEIQRYRPRVEGLFARIERWVNLSDPQDTFWRSISNDNITTWYGKTPESRIADPRDSARVFTWLICESHDDKGNVICYQYKPENSDGVDTSQAHERNRTDNTRATNRYLKRVFYGNRIPYVPDLTVSETVLLPSDWCFELVFDYGEHDDQAPVPQETDKRWDCRRDPFSTYRATFEVRTYRLCRRILMFHHFKPEPGVGLNCLVRSTDLTHSHFTQPSADSTKPFYSYLLSVTQTGYRQNADGSYLSKAFPPLEFAYTEAAIDETVRDVDAESLQNLPYGLDGSHYQWVDLDGEGLSGILTEQAGSWFYKPNLSPFNHHTDNGVTTTAAQFGPIESVARQPSLAALGRGRQQLLDLTGDGQLDLVEFSGPTPGFFERTEDGGWEPFTSFNSLPNLDWGDPNLKFVDLTGDGHADVLISKDDAFRWHQSLAKAGFGSEERVSQALDEERGPRLVFADSNHSIFLADVSGDGLTDLVRIRNGEVCYWPNLGYGRFGPKVTMDNAPWFEAPDLFDCRRIRLADIDGSATADIIYVASSGVHLYFNQSGNAWSDSRALKQFPPVESLSSATALDLLGNGTACLVWSSPLPANARQPMRYIDLMGGQKPHLLVTITNNLGAETRVEYAPSTQFYVADKMAGAPWITRLPFPVHVVERVETYDYVSRNRFVTRYVYHHGLYDGIEREFRGFGMVEQWDTEGFATLTQTGAFSDATNIDEASHVPPVCTKTWFHTGASFGEERISKHFEEEYYHEGGASDVIAGLTDKQLEAMLLDDTILPTTIFLRDGTREPYTLTADEEREACRALKGSILRQEIYALDGTDAADRPYSASERNYTIEVLQPEGPNRHAVFFVHARETVDFHYERKLFNVSSGILVDAKSPLPLDANAADPRVTHTLVLDADVFGNVLQSVAIGYGRRYADPALTGADQAKQKTNLLTYVNSGYTNAILDQDDAYRAPRPCEMNTYELTGYMLTGTRGRFQIDDFVAPRPNDRGGFDLAFIFDGEIAYEEQPTQGRQRRPVEQVRTRYRPDDLGASTNDVRALLPLGTLELLALPGETYQLAFTPGLLSEVYQRGQESLLPVPGDVLGGTGPDEGGYVDLNSDRHWWIRSGRAFHHPDAQGTPQQELDEARQHFFLPRRFEDPFQNGATVDYDPYDLLVFRTADAVGNIVAAKSDYHVLKPTIVTDPNDNRAAVSFDSLGLVAGTAVMGKASETFGDSLDSFVSDLNAQQITEFFDTDDPHVSAGLLLSTATTRIIYDIDRFKRTRDANPNDPSKWQPVFAATLARETHTSDPPPADGPKIQISFSYSDGLGREIQKKIQAEPGPLVEGGLIVNPRWVASGWTIFNNKGKPVRQYEPFFSQLPAKGHQFEFSTKIGVSPILCYDPIQRVVATIRPNHTYEKVVFDPWQQETWDVNDTVTLDPKTDPDVGSFFTRLPASDYLPTWYTQRANGALGPEEQKAATKSAIHAKTPAITYFDTLGRSFLTIANNRFDRQGATVEESYRSRVTLDIEGNQREIRDAVVQAGDAQGRAVMRYDYNMLGTHIHNASIEGGDRWTLNDVTGKLIRAWDSRAHAFRTEYGPLRRPAKSFVQGADPQNLNREILSAQTVYGERLINDKTLNLRARVFKHFDSAGVVTNEAYDFKGNLLRGSREIAENYRGVIDWSTTQRLSEAFSTSTTYDALNRPIMVITPDQSVYHPIYNEANLLDQVAVNLRGSPTVTPFVTNTNHNAKGQRVRIDYGNGASTTYEYDQNTFRLAHLETRRGDTALQDLRYTYDPSGNITHIQDAAQQTIYFNNEVVTPDTDYTYDALYRLIETTSREHIGQLEQPETTWNDEFRSNLPHPQDGRSMRSYTDRYEYDSVGNFQQIKHQTLNASWTRIYNYHEASLLEPATKTSNRLSSTTIGRTTTLSPEVYGYDPHGNMTQMPHLTMMQWDFKDQLCATSTQAIERGTPQITFYVYDASGARARKVTERQNGSRKAERLYLGGLEIYREFDGTGSAVTLERETLHVIDDRQRLALVESRTRGADSSPVQLIRYQFENQVGSASLELDAEAAVISYEEYYPYGSTSYQAVNTSLHAAAKCYRYTGKERDEETGFYYQTVRYYAAWLGRWTSCDPLGLADGMSLYNYVRTNPIVFTDKTGYQSVSEIEQQFFSADNPHARDNLVLTIELLGGLSYDPEKVSHAELLEVYSMLAHGMQGRRAKASPSVRATPSSQQILGRVIQTSDPEGMGFVAKYVRGPESQVDALQEEENRRGGLQAGWGLAAAGAGVAGGRFQMWTTTRSPENQPRGPSIAPAASAKSTTAAGRNDTRPPSPVAGPGPSAQPGPGPSPEPGPKPSSEIGPKSRSPKPQTIHIEKYITDVLQERGVDIAVAERDVNPGAFFGYDITQSPEWQQRLEGGHLTEHRTAELIAPHVVSTLIEPIPHAEQSRGRGLLGDFRLQSQFQQLWGLKEWDVTTPGSAMRKMEAGRDRYWLTYPSFRKP